jgi:hypothetical protein
MKTYVDDPGYDELNVSFNMSKSAIEDIDCEIRPNGARAQARRHLVGMRSNNTSNYGHRRWQRDRRAIDVALSRTDTRRQLPPRGNLTW